MKKVWRGLLGIALALCLYSCVYSDVWAQILVDASIDIITNRPEPIDDNEPPIRYRNKCIEACYLTQAYVEAGYYLPIYAGKDSLPNYVQKELLNLKPSYVRWTKEELDPAECRSQGQSDYCYGWHRDEMPARDTLIYTVSDTLSNPHFYYEFISSHEFIPIEGIEWREVLCVESLSKAFLESLYSTLKHEGYVDFKFKKKYNDDLHQALVSYQEDNALPIGHLDAETLYYLNLLPH